MDEFIAREAAGILAKATHQPRALTTGTSMASQLCRLAETFGSYLAATATAPSISLCLSVMLSPV